MREQAPGASSRVLKFTCCEMACLQFANQIGLSFSSTTHCELTLKMAAEEVEEDSVQIIENKKSEETSWSVTKYKTSNRPQQR